METTMIKRYPLESSVIQSAGYDAPTYTLAIEFTGGALYHYFDVPKTISAGLMSAESHGKFFNEHIRDVYRYERIW